MRKAKATRIGSTKSRISVSRNGLWEAQGAIVALAGTLATDPFVMANLLSIRKRLPRAPIAHTLEACQKISASLRGTAIYLRHDTTNELVKVVNAAQFCRERGLHSNGNGISMMLRGSVRSYHGWRLVGQNDL
jgi:hypothetical protein